MAKKRRPKYKVSLEDVMIAQIIEQEALINILEKKGVVKEKEFIKEINRLKKEFLNNNKI